MYTIQSKKPLNNHISHNSRHCYHPTHHSILVFFKLNPSISLSGVYNLSV